MKYRLVSFVLSVLIGSLLTAQSDEAYSTMMEIKSNYEACPKYSAYFDFVIEFPEEPLERQEGVFHQDGGRFYLQLGSYRWIAEDETIYFINDDALEVNISTIEEGDDVLTPTSILAMLSADKFEYYRTDDKTIELKPKLDEDYFKVKITPSENDSRLSKVKIYNKDGSRLEYRISNESCVPTFDEQMLTFDASEFENYFIEDLR